MKFLTRFGLTTALIAGLLCSVTAVQADSLSVEIQDELVTVEADNASLIAIGNRLSELSGIPVTYTEGNDRLITISLVEETMKSVVTKLSENNVLVTRKINGEDVITEIMFLLPESESISADGNLPTGGAPTDEYIEPVIDENAPVTEEYVEPVVEGDLVIDDPNAPNEVDPTTVQSQ